MTFDKNDKFLKQKEITMTSKIEHVTLIADVTEEPQKELPQFIPITEKEHKVAPTTTATASIAAPKKHNFVLVIHNACLGYSKGERITADEEIQKIIDNDYLSNCLKTHS